MEVNYSRRAFATGALASACTLAQFVAASGTVINATAGIKPLGKFVENVLDLTRQTKTTIQLINDVGTMALMVNGAVSVGDKLYVADGGKLGTSPTGYYVGFALEAATADGDIIEVFLDLPKAGGLLFQSVAATADIGASSTAEAAFADSYTLPANSLKAGDHLIIRSSGVRTGAHSTDTALLKSKIGTGIVIAGPATAGATNDVWCMEAHLVVRSVGATGKAIGYGFVGIGAAGAGTARVVAGSELTIDTTGTLALTDTCTMGVSDAGNTINQQTMSVELLRK